MVSPRLTFDPSFCWPSIVVCLYSHHIAYIMNSGESGNVMPSTSSGRGGFNRPLQSSMGRANAPMSRAGLTTGQAGGNLGGEARPMTSVSGAGFKSAKKTSDASFDPLNMNKGPAPALAEKSDNRQDTHTLSLFFVSISPLYTHIHVFSSTNMHHLHLSFSLPIIVPKTKRRRWKRMFIIWSK